MNAQRWRVPAVLLWRDRAGVIVVEPPTHADPAACSDVAFAVAELRRGRAALVAEGDTDATLAALAEGR